MVPLQMIVWSNDHSADTLYDMARKNVNTIAVKGFAFQVPGSRPLLRSLKVPVVDMLVVAVCR